MAVDISRALQLRATGMTFKSIAHELECSESYVRTKLKGIPKNSTCVEDGLKVELNRISAELQEIVRKLGG